MIRRYSGEWLAERFVKGFELYNTEFLEQLKSDPLRTVTFPSQSEIDVAERTFRALRAEWADATPRRRELLNAVEAEVSASKMVHAVVDNYATHKHPKVRKWLAAHPRLVIVEPPRWAPLHERGEPRS